MIIQNFQTIKQVRNIYCIGDSVARGLHAKKNYGQYLSEKLNIPVNNFAVSGATFLQLVITIYINKLIKYKMLI